MLSKTNYILYRECSKNAWLKVHKPEIYFAHELSDFEKSIIETGNEVELEARKLFPSGCLVDQKGAEGVALTEKVMSSGEKTIFQATFEKDGYFAAVDVLKQEDDGTWSIYEIKATNEIDKKTHYHDVTFQTILLEKCGLEVKGKHLIHLDPKYVREGELDIEKLFVIENVSEVVDRMQPEVESEMELAKIYVEKSEEPKGPCDCIYKGRSSHCTTFSYSNPDVPKYGIHDLSRIGMSKKKLLELVDGHKLNLEEVPEEMELSDAQKNQIWTYLQDQTIVSKEMISEELDKLVFPLYFLDYETFPSALPRFDGYSPYNQIPFQYSLHVLESPEAELQHLDFLYTENGDPTEAFARSMQKHIGPVGSVIVWHKDFECGRNREVGLRFPEAKNFFEDINARIFDLEETFKKQYYVHKDFKGKTSIKKVLPVLVPELSYSGLAIREGGTAAEKWNQLVGGELGDEERELIAENLRAYCKLDTYAMYAIWRELYKLINP